MTRSILSALLAAVAFVPTMAQAQDMGNDGRPERSERGQRGGDGRTERPREMPAQPAARAPQQVQVQPQPQPQPQQWRGQQGGGNEGRPRPADRNDDGRFGRAPNGNGGVAPPQYQGGRQPGGYGDRQGDRAPGINRQPGSFGDRSPGYNGNGQPYRGPAYDGNRQPDRGQGYNGNRQPGRAPGWNGNNGYDRAPGWSGNTANRGAWNRQWRGDNRYDWQRYRIGNRNAFRLPRYYSPPGWSYGYRRFGIGITLSSVLFDQDYWIDDPYAYHLPPAYGPYRWVRYYNDALLVDVRSGYVVDTIYDIFW